MTENCKKEYQKSETHIIIEWRLLLYMLLCMIIFRFLYSFVSVSYDMIVPAMVNNIVGCGVLVIGFGISIMEKWMHMPFFYAWAKDWGHHPLSNSGMVCGIGLGFLQFDLPYLIICIFGIMLLLTVQRSLMEGLHGKKK